MAAINSCIAPPEILQHPFPSTLILKAVAPKHHLATPLQVILSPSRKLQKWPCRHAFLPSAKVTNWYTFFRNFHLQSMLRLSQHIVNSTAGVARLAPITTAQAGQQWVMNTCRAGLQVSGCSCWTSSGINVIIAIGWNFRCFTCICIGWASSCQDFKGMCTYALRMMCIYIYIHVQLYVCIPVVSMYVLTHICIYVCICLCICICTCRCRCICRCICICICTCI